MSGRVIFVDPSNQLHTITLRDGIPKEKTILGPLPTQMRVRALYELTPTLLYMDYWESGAPYILDLTTGKETIVPHATDGRFMDGYVYKTEGCALTIINPLEVKALTVSMPSSFMHILARLNSQQFIGSFYKGDARYVVLLEVHRTEFRIRKYYEVEISFDFQVTSLSPTTFVIHSPDTQYTSRSHKPAGYFIFYSVEESTPIGKIIIPHTPEDMQSEFGCHLYCLFPNKTIGYYSSPSGTFITATFDGSTSRRLPGWYRCLEAISDTQVLVSGPQGIHLLNWVTGDERILYDENTQRTLTYVSD